jgi:hypothetical protein
MSLRLAARWYVGICLAANGKYESAGTYDSRERAYEVAEEEWPKRKSVTRADSWQRRARQARPR